MSEYKEYNPNPLHQRVGDCTVRALSRATNKDWDGAFAGLVAKAYELKDMPSSNSVWGAYLRDEGFHRDIMPDTCPDCYTVREFARDHPKGVYILALKSHVVAVVDGDWYDSWDSGDEVPLYYWRKG